MKKNLLLGGAVLAMVILSIYVTNNYQISNADAVIPAAVVQEQAEGGETQVADFTLSDLEGNPVSLSDYSGKVVFLNFWATWCKWCKKEMPDMERIYEQYKDQDVVLLAISVGEDRDKVNDFIQEHGYSFPVLLDPGKTVAEAYQVKPIPVSIFIDRNGHIAYRKLGYMAEEQMKAQIDALIS